MALQVTVNKSLMSKLDAIKKDAEDQAKGIGIRVVTTAVEISPVDTGAYVESFSVVPRGAGGGRSRTSRGKPRNQNPQVVKEEELKRLLAELDAIPDISDGFTLRNRSPHSNFVEYGVLNEDGSPRWKVHPFGYRVFEKIRDIFR